MSAPDRKPLVLLSGTVPSKSDKNGWAVACYSKEAIAAGGLPSAPTSVRPLPADVGLAFTAKAKMMPPGLAAGMATTDDDLLAPHFIFGAHFDPGADGITIAAVFAECDL